MKGKLIKTVDGYELFTQGFLKGSTNHGLIESLNIEEGPIRYKLSVKNCQAIERGYDLDELALEFIGEDDGHPSTIEQSFCFKKGFQKALEILGDKKFTENNIDEAFDAGHEMLDSPKNYNDVLKEFKESLEPTEWDVEIVMVPAMSNNGNVYYGDISKLDPDGCLTLKRI